MGIGPDWRFPPEYTNGQQAHEHMKVYVKKKSVCNVIKESSWNHNEIYPLG